MSDRPEGDDLSDTIYRMASRQDVPMLKKQPLWLRVQAWCWLHFGWFRDRDD